tara:strand:+ start:2167 stop:2385 length:219 start_codon:yes stop_codon:yes gene_type:complete
MNDLLKDLTTTIVNKYNGKLICKNQKENLFVWKNGIEETIVKVDTEYIYFKNEKVKLIDSDINHLVYLKKII